MQTNHAVSQERISNSTKCVTAAPLSPTIGQAKGVSITIDPSGWVQLPRIKTKEYQIVAQIGGMGVVWKMKDVVLQGTLAIKIQNPSDSTERGVKRRFTNEAQVCTTATQHCPRA